MRTNASILLCLSFISISLAFFPGSAPHNFKDGERVELKMNKLTSINTQLPFEYYSLPFCREKEGFKKDPENIGELLLGDRVESSPYDLKFKVNENCKLLCSLYYSAEDAEKFVKKINYQYKVHWILDHLPAVSSKPSSHEKTEPKFENGFALGGLINDNKNDKTKHSYKLNNHVDMTILYSEETPGERIVGFEVKPKSFKYPDNTNTFDCLGSLDALIIEKKAINVTWTYSVTWQKSEIQWINRWDRYLQTVDPQIHWFSIINSLMIVVFLTGMIAMIMMRTLHADFRRYNQEMGEEVEETGWKLVHADVFRPPQRPMLLSVLIGSGVQVFAMALVTMIFAALGFLSPANRGALLSSMVVLFVVMGVFAGYFSTRTFRMLKGNSWKKCTVYTSITFPGIAFAIFFVLDIAMATKGSSGAVPVGTLFSILLLWVGISTPLVFLGSYYAYKQPDVQQPVRTNQIPRQIPEQIWYMHPIFSILMGGILPFGAVFIELLFILTAIWAHQFYYIFGFLFLVFVILVITCSEISIIMCYFQLCSEDYHWWWRSFLTSGSSAFYMFLYAIYFYRSLNLTEFVPKLLYFGYTLIMTFGFFVLTGAIGYFSCYLFIRKIYSQVKVD
eukprot:TRINITY_DN88_c0_g2_i1.p1 TRINITY_DN88_c0_g2~~TRINITY_DN88_c0_g2_i1.p1  ORF type:complete len:630 (+),score=205.75 TRINITY_DN88_c0_g2_i1:39-1892(+)